MNKVESNQIELHELQHIINLLSLTNLTDIIFEPNWTIKRKTIGKYYDINLKIKLPLSQYIITSQQSKVIITLGKIIKISEILDQKISNTINCSIIPLPNELGKPLQLLIKYSHTRNDKIILFNHACLDNYSFECEWFGGKGDFSYQQVPLTEFKTKQKIKK